MVLFRLQAVRRTIPPEGGTTNSGPLIPLEREQGHESGPLDGAGHGVLAGRGATALAAAYDAPVAVCQLFEQLDVLIVHEHRSRPFPFHENRVTLGSSRLGLGTLTGLRFGRWSGHVLVLELAGRGPLSRVGV